MIKVIKAEEDRFHRETYYAYEDGMFVGMIWRSFKPMKWHVGMMANYITLDSLKEIIRLFDQLTGK